MRRLILFEKENFGSESAAQLYRIFAHMRKHAR